MKDLFIKELKLSASPLSYCFIAFGLMFFLPGYPILCGAFFVSFGIFQSFLYAREANDTLFTALLPVRKSDVVRGKFLFAVFIEGCGFLLMLSVTLLRMTVFRDVIPYRSNALMNANLFALGMSLFIFGLFNFIFIGGFFKTAYKFTAPFISYCVAGFVVIGMAEALHHIPPLSPLNAFGFEHFTLQAITLVGGVLVYLILTCVACRISIKRFERIDL